MGMTTAPVIHYLIYVRPIGSLVWTQHMKFGTNGLVPWTHTNPDVANAEAVKIADETTYCARVIPIEHIPQPDAWQSARLADGDSIYYPKDKLLLEPDLPSVPVGAKVFKYGLVSPSNPLFKGIGITVRADTREEADMKAEHEASMFGTTPQFIKEI